jgi:predicted CopG family antitoxin
MKHVKKKLERLKVHPREPFNDVIKRLIEFYEKSSKKT